MTTPALLVLSLALVCSIFGTASEQTADHDSRHVNMKQNRDTDIQVQQWIDYEHKVKVKSKSESQKDKVENKMTPINGTKLRRFNEILEKHSRYDRLYYKRNNYNNNGNKIIDPNISSRINNKVNFIEAKDSYDEIYEDHENILETNLRLHKMNIAERNGLSRLHQDIKRRVKREEEDPRCELFKFNVNNKYIMHPHAKNMSTYYNNSNCVTVINATSDDMVIELTFVDIFRIENHSECAYDYLEIRDGIHGYAAPLGKLCGQTFPRQITTTGPHAWLKFYSDDTIEYEGFKINIAFKNGPSVRIPNACYITKNAPSEDKFGIIDSKAIAADCLTGSENQPLDVLWKIETADNTKIYLNFTKYHLQKPNECDQNVIQVFGAVLELNAMLSHFCGSVANSVTTKDSDGSKGEKEDKGNVMYVRFHVAKAAKEDTYFNATYNAYRTLDPSKESEKCLPEEFSCEDNTCIALELKCDGMTHCRLKADEERCDNKTESTISQPHIMVILIIFSLILSGMCFVFIFKCMRKLYQDHKLITEHFKQSCEDRLDRLGSVDGSRLTLDPKMLQRDSEPRASLERENHTNEMYKKQRSFSKHEPSSRESDFIEETHLDLEDDPWRREAESIPIEEQNISIERNGRTRRSDMSRKEESIRSRTKESESRVKKEIRDVSVGAPDTKESGCQTRESLFQTDPPPSSDGSGTQSRGFSTFGYSGATIVRPSPPDQTKTSEITIELTKQAPPQESKLQKKHDRRPISTETTRSAPDVIIVSKPIR